jgi:Fe-S cluster assembly protein SufD
MKTEVITTETIKAFEEAFYAEERTPQQVRAFDAFRETGLPSRKSEEYRFTPIGKFLEANFDLSLYGHIPLNQSQSEIGNQSLAINICNGHVFLNVTEFKSAGILVSIDSERQEAFNNDPFLLLNHAFSAKEIRIEIPANLKVEKPIHINHLMDSEGVQVMLNASVSVVLQENSSCQIIEMFQSSGINPVFTNIAAQYILHKGSQLDYFRLQDDATTYQVYNSIVRQVGMSTVNSFVFSLDGNVVRNNSIFSIEEEFCESNFYGLYFPNEKSLIDNHTVADHKRANCVSNELYKGIIGDQGKGVFNGKIYVRQDAQKTNAFQSNRNILLSDSATINTKPQLEIWADDVKCSHGCTTGQIDKEALFYLQSRGISEEQAKSMLLMAFAYEVINKVQDEELRKRIEHLIKSRLQQQLQ